MIVEDLVSDAIKSQKWDFPTILRLSFFWIVGLCAWLYSHEYNYHILLNNIFNIKAYLEQLFGEQESVVYFPIILAMVLFLLLIISNLFIIFIITKFYNFISILYYNNYKLRRNIHTTVAKSHLFKTFTREVESNKMYKKIADVVVTNSRRVLRSPYYYTFKIHEDISSRYGLDLRAWHWLKLLLPEAAIKEIEIASKSMGNQYELFFTSIAITIWTIWAWWVLPLALAAIIYIYYWPLTSSSTNLYLKISVSFDLYRNELYKSFDFPIPKSKSDELKAGKELMDYLQSIMDSRVKKAMPIQLS